MRKSDLQSVRERLIQTAEQQIVMRGPRNLRMDDLAHSMGVSKKTIYRVVSSKETIIELIIERFVRQIRSEMDQLIDDPEIPFLEKLEMFFQVISKGLQRFNSRVFIELERFYPPLFKKVERIRRQNIPAVIGRLLAQGQQEGQVREDLDIPFFCEVFLQSAHGLLRTESLQQHGLQPHEIPKRLGQLFIHGIRKPQSRTELSSTEKTQP